MRKRKRNHNNDNIQQYKIFTSEKKIVYLFSVLGTDWVKHWMILLKIIGTRWMENGKPCLNIRKNFLRLVEYFIYTSALS